MGERDNGYASCDVRRGLRGRGWNGLGGSARQSRDDDNGGCGICNVLRGGCSRPSRDDDNGGCGCNERRGRDGDETRCGNTRIGQNGGCGYGCGRRNDRTDEDGCIGQECHALMHKLQQLDFSIQETVLYLNAYPDCCAALTHYHRLLAEREQVVAQYEQSCGPLSVHGKGCRTSWDWVKAPWPWQPGFPGNGSGKQG